VLFAKKSWLILWGMVGGDTGKKTKHKAPSLHVTPHDSKRVLYAFIS
jgi:hypothetical protein